MRKILDGILTNLLVILMTIMVLSALLQVFARVINLNVPFTEELTIYGMMWVALFGSAYAFGLKKHIAIDALIGTIKQHNRWKLEIIIEFMIVLFALIVLVIGGSRFVFITFKLGQVSSVMQFPKGWVYLALPVSGVLILIYNALSIIEILRNRP